MCEMEISYLGSSCGRYVYAIILENGVEIDRYVDIDMTEFY